jgi:hypothetical protein
VRSSSGRAAEEHPESSALYRAIAGDGVSEWKGWVCNGDAPATRCSVDFLGVRNRGMHETARWELVKSRFRVARNAVAIECMITCQRADGGVCMRKYCKDWNGNDG